MKYLMVLVGLILCNFVYADDVRYYTFQNGTLQVPEIGSKKAIAAILAITCPIWVIPALIVITLFMVFVGAYEAILDLLNKVFKDK